MSAPPSPAPRRPLVVVGVLVAATLVGVALPYVAMPRLFARIPTDLQRIGYVLQALAAPPPELSVVVLGTSVTQSAIDARQLSQELPGAPLAWNLASPGQSLVESYLLQQQLPGHVEWLVQSLSPGELASPIELRPQKYNAFYLYGYRPSPETLRVLSETFGPGLHDVLTASDAAQRFQGRWALRQLVDASLRRVLRTDLKHGEADRDLFHPQRYTAPFPPEKMARILERQLADMQGQEIRILDAKRSLLDAMVRRSQASGRGTLLLVPPVHPALYDAFGERYFPELLASLEPLARQPGVVVVDATRTLGAEHFVDDRHPTDAGARVVTAYLAQALARARGAGTTVGAR